MTLAGAIFLTGGVREDQRLNETISNPQHYDVMFSDLGYAKVSNMSLVDLGFHHNSPTSDRPSFPIKGIVAVAPSYGRTVGGVVLKYKKKSIQSFFVFDTGAPGVYICERTFRALGIEHADHASLIVHGQPTGVLRSSGHFTEVNVMGASYFLENKLELTVNYRTRKVSINMTPVLTEEQEDEL